MMSGKCISHFKMLSSVSRTYYGEVAMSSPIFYFIFLLLLLLFYVLKGNSRVILSLLLGFTPVWASCSMSYQAIVISYFCWTTVWTSICRCPIPLLSHISLLQEEVAFWKDHFRLPLQQVWWPFDLRELEQMCFTSSWSRPASLVFFCWKAALWEDLLWGEGYYWLYYSLPDYQMVFVNEEVPWALHLLLWNGLHLLDQKQG